MGEADRWSDRSTRPGLPDFLWTFTGQISPLSAYVGNSECEVHTKVQKKVR